MMLIDKDRLLKGSNHYWLEMKNFGDIEAIDVRFIEMAEEIKAIPIEWIQNKYREKWEKDEMRRGDFQFCEVIHDLLEMWDLEKEDWEKENEGK